MWAKEHYKAYAATAYHYCREYFKGPWWFNHSDHIAKFTGWVAFFTLILAIVGILQWLTLKNTDETARQTQRAFVISYDLAIVPIVVDNDIVYWKVAPMIENSGNSTTEGMRY